MYQTLYTTAQHIPSLWYLSKAYLESKAWSSCMSRIQIIKQPRHAFVWRTHITLSRDSTTTCVALKSYVTLGRAYNILDSDHLPDKKSDMFDMPSK
jgi:hypothetical protein